MSEMSEMSELSGASGSSMVRFEDPVVGASVLTFDGGLPMPMRTRR